ncbi:unnamed protein product [Cochlearia groenlandica]
MAATRAIMLSRIKHLSRLILHQSPPSSTRRLPLAPNCVSGGGVSSDDSYVSTCRSKLRQRFRRDRESV